MGVIARPRISAAVVDRIEVLSEDLSQAFGCLLDLDVQFKAENINTTGLEGHGDHIHMMTYLNAIRVQVLRWQRAAFDHSVLIDPDVLKDHTEALDQDLATANRLYAAL